MLWCISGVTQHEATSLSDARVASVPTCCCARRQREKKKERVFNIYAALLCQCVYGLIFQEANNTAVTALLTLRSSVTDLRTDFPFPLLLLVSRRCRPRHSVSGWLSAQIRVSLLLPLCSLPAICPCPLASTPFSFCLSSQPCPSPSFFSISAHPSIHLCSPLLASPVCPLSVLVFSTW